MSMSKFALKLYMDQVAKLSLPESTLQMEEFPDLILVMHVSQNAKIHRVLMMSSPMQPGKMC